MCSFVSENITFYKKYQTPLWISSFSKEEINHDEKFWIFIVVLINLQNRFSFNSYFKLVIGVSLNSRFFFKDDDESQHVL